MGRKRHTLEPETIYVLPDGTAVWWYEGSDDVLWYDTVEDAKAAVGIPYNPVTLISEKDFKRGRRT